AAAVGRADHNVEAGGDPVPVVTPFEDGSRGNFMTAASIFIVCGAAGSAKLAEPSGIAKPAPSKSGFIFSSMTSVQFCRQNGQSRGGFCMWREITAANPRI